MVSGSSAAGREVAREIGAIAVRYPEPADRGRRSPGTATARPSGIRIGIIARDGSGRGAWRVAHERFPADRKGQIAHALAHETSPTRSGTISSRRSIRDEPDDDPYWLHPFQNYQTFCPYLVGSYERVAQEVAPLPRRRRVDVILDVPRVG